MLVNIPGGTHGLKAYLAQPEGDGPFPGLVVIHEAFGLNDDIRRIADRFAAENYVALAVDLFAGRNRAVCMFRFMAAMLTHSLDHSGIRDLKVALTFLENQSIVDAARLGVIGFCLGGNLAITWACTDDRLKVAAPFYGLNPRPLEAVARACPVVGSYPGSDITAGAGRKLAAELEKYGIVHDIEVYPGATHSFFNGDQTGHEANQRAAQESWERVVKFFAEYLKS